MTTKKLLVPVCAFWLLTLAGPTLTPAAAAPRPDREVAPGPTTYLVFGPAERMMPLPSGVEVLGPAGQGTLVQGPAARVEILAQRGMSLVRLKPGVDATAPPARRSMPPLPPRTQAFNPLVADIVLRMSIPEVTATIQRLQDFETRYSLSDSCRAAAMYLKDRFEAYGLPTVLDLFSVNGHVAYNVIAEKQGTLRPEEIYIICGHYDSISGDPYVAAPGADDNGSGTAAVVEAARVLASTDFEATIRFIAFAGEEQGLIGSEDYVTGTIVPNNDDLRAVLNLDMIGYVHPDYPDWDANWYADLGVSLALGEYVQQCVQTYTTCTMYLTVTPGPQYGSDHYWFAANGYPAAFDIDAQLWGAPDWNPHYHSPQDRIETLDLGYATEMARGAVAALAELAVPAEGAAVAEPGPLALAPASPLAAPNPFRNGVAFEVGSGLAHLTIVDVAGRVVAELSGSDRVVWNGDDARGRAVAPGTYFYRIDGAAETSGRIVRVR